MTPDLESALAILRQVAGGAPPRNGRRWRDVAPLDEAEARRGILSAVATFRRVEQERKVRIVGADRVKHFAALLESARKLREGYESTLAQSDLVDPLSWAMDEDPADVEAGLADQVVKLRAQEAWLAHALEEARKATPKGRPPQSQPLAALVRPLAEVYERSTGIEVSAAHSTSVWRDSTGPFPRFVAAVAEAAGLPPQAVAKYAAHALSGEDRQRVADRRVDLIARYSAAGEPE